MNKINIPWDQTITSRFEPSTLPNTHALQCLTSAQMNTLQHAMRILQDRRAVLICEDTGTGKSFIAAALAHTLTTNHDIDSILIIGPAHLRYMWQSVMTRFALPHTYQSYQMASLNHTPHTTPNTLIIVDEAHFLKNCHTKRYQNLAPILRTHLLCLLTATPISLGFQDLSALMHLCGLPDKFQNDENALRMFTMALCPRFFTNPLTLNLSHKTIQRQQLTCHLPDDTHKIIQLILHTPWPVFEHNKTTFSHLIPQLLIHRYISHPKACQNSLTHLQRYYRACLKTGAMRPVSRREFFNMFGIEGIQLPLPFGLPNDAAPCDDLFTHLDNINQAIKTALQYLQIQLDQPDERITRLQTLITSTDCPVILFTQYADTALYYAQKLTSSLPTACIISNRATLCNHQIDRVFLQNMFDPDCKIPNTWKTANLPIPRLLVTTDTLSTGHNLQRASVLIHLDIPWNPTTLQQREGRIIRQNQTADHLHIATFKYQNVPNDLQNFLNYFEKRFKNRVNIRSHWTSISTITNTPKHFLFCDIPKQPALWAQIDANWLPIHPTFAKSLKYKQKLTLHSALLRNQHPDKHQLQLLKLLIQQTRYDSKTLAHLQHLEEYAEITALWPSLRCQFSEDPTTAFQQICEYLRSFTPIPGNTPAFLLYSKQ